MVSGAPKSGRNSVGVFVDVIADVACRSISQRGIADFEFRRARE